MDIQKNQEVVAKPSNSRNRATNKSRIRASINMRTIPRLTKDRMLHKSIFKDGGLPEGTRVYYISGGEVLCKGKKQGRGILCDCCYKLFSASQFEVHAGMTSRKKPYGNIFLADGVSLHEYACTLKLERNDDQVCIICKGGGHLLPCNGCSRSFHKECTSESRIHEKKWFCGNCWKTMKCVGQNAIEQITKQRIQIVSNLDEHNIVACVLCGSCEFNENGFNDHTVIICDQCEKEYHIGCLRKFDKADLKELPQGNWFCLKTCEKLHSTLDALASYGPREVSESLIDMVWKKSNKNDTGSITISNVKWVLIRGKDASAENTRLLAEAINIFQDCFDPIIDSLTGSDFIPLMAYGLKMGALDFVGVHCAMLTLNSKVVTVGMFRVFGKNCAELSLVATSQSHQGKGYFRLFLSCFEQLLSYLGVDKLVVPAANDAKAMWIEIFGLRTVSRKDLRKYRETQTSMVPFQGTTLLEKEIPQCHNTYFNGAMFSL